ncbi:hypothetical protein J8273_6558 [Carpediemonas membranifera]|uniref:Tyrosine-protein kinase ephrin type A/B receptor-like domain-containing protein n=1 Tax=Carpediemonas membranifera TaxID=201153 RepID=A0A8J6DY89_9EUKA|nr:hypothetical protein J8273_6558 [Carpediemonas membranifera]|eukprot:KAG9391779.1 hypothetical protein J8273_6558 [Carpediemonas membranifera]
MQYASSWFTCATCPAGTYSEAHSLECRTCPTGYAVNPTNDGCDATFPPMVSTDDPAGAASGYAFGAGLASFEHFIVVGSPGDGTGKLQLLQYAASSWTLVDTHSSSIGTNLLGSAIVMDDRWVIAGAPGISSESGSVLAVLRFGTFFSDSPQVITSRGTTGGEFGKTLALDGGTLVVAWPSEGTGSVTVYVLDADDVWQPDTDIACPDDTNGAEFGLSLALSGTVLAVGAPSTTDHAKPGIVAVYRFNSAWPVTPDQTLTFDPPAAGEEFGRALALEDGATLFVGYALYTHTAGTVDVSNTGAVARYVYSPADTTWAIDKRMLALTPTASEEVGTSIVVTGSALFAAAPYADITTATTTTSVPDGGLAYTFDLESGSHLTPIAPDYDAVTLFGSSIASDRAVVFGAPDTGSTGRIFILAKTDCPANYYGSDWHSCTACPSDSYSTAGSLTCVTCSADQTVVRTNSGGQCVSSLQYVPVEPPAAITYTANDFGMAVVIVDDVIVVGAPAVPDASAAPDMGRVYVYQFNPTMLAFDLEQTLVIGDSVAGDRCGTALATTNMQLFVGSPSHDTDGVVYIYNRDGAVFSYSQTITAADQAGASGFGTALAASSSFLVVGAPASTFSAVAGAGGAVIYTPSAGTYPTWTFSAFIGNSAFQQCGLSLALGCPGDASTGVNCGVSTHTFSSGWASVTPLPGTDNTLFGQSVAMADGFLTVGAPSDSFGAVYSFERSTAGWVDSIIPSFAAASDIDLGMSVGMANGYAAAGVPQFDPGALPASTGAVYIYTEEYPRYWAESFYIQPADTDQVASGNLGSTVAMTANAIIAATPSDGQTGRIFVWSSYNCPAGQYADTWHSCADCPSGSVFNGSPFFCTPCDPGYYSLAGSSECIPASSGYFVPNDGQPHATQTLCPAGQYQHDEGQTSCITATAGYAVVDPDAPTAIETCTAGHYSSSDGATACTPASAGHYVPADAQPHTSQETCPSGEHQSLTGQTSCELCAAGSFAATGGLADCTEATTDHYVPLEGSTTELPCGIGASQTLTGQASCDTDYAVLTLAPDPSLSAPHDFGVAVAAEGDLILASVYPDATNVGAIAKYEFSAATWAFAGLVTPAADHDHWGAKIALSSAWIVVSTGGHSNYVEAAPRSSTTFGTFQQITPTSVPHDSNAFGTAIAVSDSGLVVVGVPDSTSGAVSGHGAFYVFENATETGGWVQTATSNSAIVIATMSGFGKHVGIADDGSTAIILVGHDDSSQDPVLAYTAGSVSAAPNPTLTVADVGAPFAVSGETVAAAGPTYTVGSDANAGSIAVYDAIAQSNGDSLASWDPDADEAIGTAIGIGDGYLAVTSSARGRVYLWTKGTGFTQATQFVHTGSFSASFGTSVAVSSFGLVWSDPETDAGLVYIVNPPNCSAGRAIASFYQCTACAAGTANPYTGQLTCQNCFNGSYSDTPGRSECLNATAGHYVPNVDEPHETFSTCLAGQTSADGASQCTDCAATEYAAAGASSCTTIPAGSHGVGDHSAAVQCSAGTAQHLTGQASCYACNNGNYSSSDGATSCSQADEGHYVPADSGQHVTQESCTPGTAQNETGQASCFMCNGGFFSNTSAATACFEADRGYYVPADITGKTSALPCNSGKYSPVTGASGCLTCPSGWLTPSDGAYSGCSRTVSNNTDAVIIDEPVTSATFESLTCMLVSDPDTGKTVIVPLTANHTVVSGNYSLEVETSGGSSSHTLSVESDLEIGSPTVSLGSGSLEGIVISTICPASMTLGPYTEALTAVRIVGSEVLCVTDKPVTGTELHTDFTPSFSDVASGTSVVLCVGVAEVDFTDTTGVTLVVDDVTQPAESLFLQDGDVCVAMATASSVPTVDAVFTMTTGGFKVAAFYSGELFVSVTPLVTDPIDGGSSSSGAIVAVVIVLLLLLLVSFCCCIAIAAVLVGGGAFVAVDAAGVFLFISMKKGKTVQSAMDVDPATPDVPAATPRVLPPSHLPALPSMPNAVPINAVAKPTPPSALPRIGVPLSPSPIAAAPAGMLPKLPIVPNGGPSDVSPSPLPSKPLSPPPDTPKGDWTKLRQLKPGQLPSSAVKTGAPKLQMPMLPPIAPPSPKSG